MVIGKPSLAGQFNYYTDGSRSNFVSFENQPNTAQNYSNTSVHIFGWKNNSFQEITNQWLPNNTNLVEGVVDLINSNFKAYSLVSNGL